MKNKNPHYSVLIEYSEEDAGYVARVPALPHCTAFGETYEEAAREIQEAITGWLDAAKEAKLPIPAPGPSVEELQASASLLNLAKVARESGIPEQTLFTKLRRRTPLRSKEALGIARALNNAGLAIIAQNIPNPRRVAHA